MKSIIISIFMVTLFSLFMASTTRSQPMKVLTDAELAEVDGGEFLIKCRKCTINPDGSATCTDCVIEY
jgi:bacteriocin-like protein